jgi:hypothetical protein
MVCAFEQRHSERSEVSWPVSIWHPKASRFFNGRSVNVSTGGALVRMPLQSPVREGQDIELNFPRGEELASKKGCSARIKAARVVRVDRSDMLNSATIQVGLEFCDKQGVEEEAAPAVL